MAKPPADPPAMSYVESVRITMDSVRDLGMDVKVLYAQFRQLLDLAAQLDDGRDLITLHKEFRLALSGVIALAESRRKEIAEQRNRALDLLTVIEMERQTDDAELERQMAALPVPPGDDDPAAKKP